ncbi:MAG: virginiamycin lyase, partial [Actinomycetota bacterium]|nr:virginiamycin lyase [Actinomycetota bacterium]
MSDMNDKLREALKSVGESFRPEDIATKQRQFIKLRKRRRIRYFGGSLALGAAVIAAVLFVTSGTTPIVDKNDEKPVPPAGEPHPVITAVIQVGRGTSGIDVGPSGVWVANHEDGTISRIDPSTNQVTAEIAIGPGDRGSGTPDDVAVGADRVWVGDDDQHAVYALDPDTGEPGPAEVLEEGPAHIDLTVAPGKRLWAVSGSSSTAYELLDPRVPGLNLFSSPLPETATDVANSTGIAWYLSAETGALMREQGHYI